MDVVYFVVALAFWLVLIAMAKGCAALGGPEQ
jgi:hypothetical protein